MDIQARNKKPGLAHQERANLDRGLKPQLHRNSVHNTTYCCRKSDSSGRDYWSFHWILAVTSPYAVGLWPQGSAQLHEVYLARSCLLWDQSWLVRCFVLPKHPKTMYTGLVVKALFVFHPKQMFDKVITVDTWQWYWDEGLNHKPAKVDVVPFNPLEFEDHRIRGKCIPTHFFGFPKMVLP